MLYTSDHFTVIVGAIVIQDGADTIRPMLAEVSLNIYYNRALITVKVFLSLLKRVPCPCRTFMFHSPLYHSLVR